MTNPKWLHNESLVFETRLFIPVLCHGGKVLGTGVVWASSVMWLEIGLFHKQQWWLLGDCCGVRGIKHVRASCYWNLIHLSVLIYFPIPSSIVLPSLARRLRPWNVVSIPKSRTALLNHRPIQVSCRFGPVRVRVCTCERQGASRRVAWWTEVWHQEAFFPPSQRWSLSTDKHMMLWSQEGWDAFVCHVDILTMSILYVDLLFHTVKQQRIRES